jgi:hypothetical protein
MAASPPTSDPRRVATRGLPMALMSGGTPEINVNKPTMPTMFALRLRAGLMAHRQLSVIRRPASISPFTGGLHQQIAEFHTRSVIPVCYKSHSLAP